MPPPAVVREYGSCPRSILINSPDFGQGDFFAQDGTEAFEFFLRITGENRVDDAGRFPVSLEVIGAASFQPIGDILKVFGGMQFTSHGRAEFIIGNMRLQIFHGFFNKREVYPADSGSFRIAGAGSFDVHSYIINQVIFIKIPDNLRAGAVGI